MGVKRQLLRAGINNDDIPNQWLPAIIAAMEKWLVTTDEGLQYTSNLYGFELKPSDDDKTYTLIDNVNRNTTELKNNQVWVFKGYLVNGKVVPEMDYSKENPIPPQELEISESTKNKCEDCGIVSHCLKDILEPSTDRLTSLCNYCISFHEHPRVSDQGGWQICEKCSVTRCKNHPGETRRTHVQRYANMAR